MPSQEKKSFFREKTVSEIRELNIKTVYTAKDLVQRIDDLDPSEDALEIRTFLIPQNFRRGKTGAEASRKCYKHGKLIALPQPHTLRECYDSSLTPLDLRTRALEELQKMKQQEIFIIGYSWRPVSGRNETKRVVRFRDLAEGAKIFTYAENFSVYKTKDKETGKTKEKKGIEILAYPDAKRVKTEGACVVCRVPSRTEKRERYPFGLMSVPFVPNDPSERINYNLAIALRLEPFLLTNEETGELLAGLTIHDIFDRVQYEFENAREQSQDLKFSPQQIAAYMGVISRQFEDSWNPTALHFNPFALLSKHQAEFYTKSDNNVLIYDPTLTRTKKDGTVVQGGLRTLHLAEKSIFLARAIGHFGPSDFAYWDPTRDKKFKDYNWGIKGISS